MSAVLGATGIDEPQPPRGDRGAVRMRLLVVEDDEVLRAAIVEASRCWEVELEPDRAIGFDEILEADNVDDGVALLARRPDLVLVDVRLHAGSGLSVARAASEMHPTPLVLAMSGHASAGEAFSLAQSGVRGYLAKPFDLTELRAAVQGVLREPPRLEPHVKAQVGQVYIHTVQDQVRRAMVEQALARSDGNFVHAARLLGVTRQAVQQMVDRLGLAHLRGRPAPKS